MAIIEKWMTKPLIVTAKWLTACANEGRTVGEEDFLFNADNKQQQTVNDSASSVDSRKEMPPPSNMKKCVNETSNETYLDDDLMRQYCMDGQTSRRESLDCSTFPDSQESSLRNGIFKGTKLLKLRMF